MEQNNWKHLWSNRCADELVLQCGDLEKVFMELKRSNGFDVVKDGIPYESFLEQYREMKERLLGCAKQVLRTTDIRCEEAYALPAEPKYDAVVSVSVFGYFSDEDYAEVVLERMCQKANYAVGVLELADIDKKEAYIAHRKQIIPDYEQRYRGLPRLFYSKAFFESFAHKHGMGIEISPMTMKDYWNSQFYFDCYLYKR